MQVAVKEREDAAAKMKAAVADKVKFQAVADSRLQDVCNLRKEVLTLCPLELQDKRRKKILFFVLSS